MKKIFLFDIGNVIFKIHDIKKLYEELKCTCSLEEFIKCFRDSDYYRNVEKGLISTCEFIDSLKRDTGSNVDYDEYIRIHWNTKGPIYNDTIDLMNRLKNAGYKIGILSNLQKIDVDHFKTIFDTKKLDYEFYSCYLNDMKPSLDIYEHVAKITDAHTNEVYFFDDLLENCEGAKKCGIRAICTTGDTILEDFKTHIGLEGELYE